MRKFQPGLTPQDVEIPLAFPSGQEAQVDWGEAQLILNGQPTTVYLRCIRTCHSKKPFVRAYPTIIMGLS